ncbi:MopE-related protein [Nannocystis punicea]|uniref:MopE-related protein n=1 Tax=Nannocystis punicea TaxID=2995304 RepID=A0ABY7GZJ5_9BACT|nr:MopE-related protein [Nannocystis poenicansa]WAS92412.1 MopE-related protein [Nannocystis poenicansa]
MRRVAVFLLVLAAGCTFDASGLGETPQTGAGAGPTTTTGSTTEPGPLTDTGPGPATTSDETVGVSGSESMTDGTGGPGGDPTSMPSLTTTGEPETTTQPMTSTTMPDMTTGCPLVMAYKDFDNDNYGDPNMPMLVCEGEQGWVPDNTDCNDMAAYSHPGIIEMCDTLDNDCDGMFDEYDAEQNSESCAGCRFVVREDSLYYFCTNSLEWEQAEKFCVGHGLHLAKDDGGAEHDFLVQEIGDTGLWWLGGNDLMTEGTFKWVSDGVNVAGDGWGNNQPDDQEWLVWEEADCMVLVDNNGVGGYFGEKGKWADSMCDGGLKFICEGPLP